MSGPGAEEGRFWRAIGLWGRVMAIVWLLVVCLMVGALMPALTNSDPAQVPITLGPGFALVAAYLLAAYLCFRLGSLLRGRGLVAHLLALAFVVVAAVSSLGLAAVVLVVCYAVTAPDREPVSLAVHR